jgi:hypothetical protein
MGAVRHAPLPVSFVVMRRLAIFTLCRYDRGRHVVKKIEKMTARV